MSSIPTKQIDGDVSVSRNVSTGGDASIRGNARVGHNLIVEGWLEARNLKVCNKGFFPTYSLLEKRYPQPEPGWWAIVGDTLPAPIYIVKDGKWITNGKEFGSLEVDFSGFEDAIRGLYAEIEKVGNQIPDTQKIEKQIQDLSTTQQQLSTEQKQLSTIQQSLAKEVSSQGRRIDLLEAGDDGVDCPSYLSFDGFVDGVEYQLVSPVVDYDVVFDRVHGMFLCRVPSVSGLQTRIVPGYDYEYFRGAQLAQYNEAGLDGKAHRDRLYVDGAERLYRFDGAALVQVAGVNSRVMTQTEYDALVTPDSDTIYYITE